MIRHWEEIFGLCSWCASCVACDELLVKIIGNTACSWFLARPEYMLNMVRTVSVYQEDEHLFSWWLSLVIMSECDVQLFIKCEMWSFRFPRVPESIWQEVQSVPAVRTPNLPLRTRIVWCVFAVFRRICQTNMVKAKNREWIYCCAGLFICSRGVRGSFVNSLEDWVSSVCSVSNHSRCPSPLEAFQGKTANPRGTVGTWVCFCI